MRSIATRHAAGISGADRGADASSTALTTCSRCRWARSGAASATPAHLPLLRDAEAPAYRSGRLGADGAARRAAASGHAAAAPVEEREADAVVPADAGDPLLRPVERPVGREVPAVLVAVGVPDHHRLLAAARRQVGAVGLQREELGQHGWRPVEIVERLEERRHRQPAGITGPASEDEDRQHVGGRPRDRDHEWPGELGSVHRPGPGEQPEQRPGLARQIVEPLRVGRRGRGWRGGGEESLESAVAFGPGSRGVAGVHSPGAAELIERPGETAGILPAPESRKATDWRRGEGTAATDGGVDAPRGRC